MGKLSLALCKVTTIEITFSKNLLKPGIFKPYFLFDFGKTLLKLQSKSNL